MAGLIVAGMLIDAYGDGGLPKVSAANRETVRIMKTIKIPPPYTPVYQPYVWQQYLPPENVTPDYSPKVGPVQPFSIPTATAVALSALPVTATNTASASVTNVPVADKTVKTSAPAIIPENEKAPEVSKPVEKTQPVEKK